MENGEISEVSTKLHKIKGCAGNLRMNEAFEMLQEVEDYSKKGDIEGLKNLIPKIESFIGRIIDK